MKLDDLTIFLRAQDKTGKAFTAVSKRLKTLKKAAVASTAAFTAVGTALAATFRANAPYIDALAKTADKLGIATESLQAYRDAAEFAGIRQNALDVGLQRFTRRLSEANQGSKGLVAGLKELGLNAGQLIAAGPEKAFESMIEAIQKIPSETERIRLAFKFFDTEGVDLVRLTTKAIEESRLEMEQLNLTISRVDAARVEMANDALKRLGDIARGVGRRITVGISGAVVVLTNRIVDAAKTFVGFNNDSVDSSEKILRAVGRIVDIFRPLRTAIDFTRFGIIELQVRFLQFGRTVAELFDKNILGALSKVPGAVGEFARELTAAGGITAEVSGKITKLQDKQSQLLENVRNRANAPSFADALVEDLRKVNSEAEKAAQSVSEIVDKFEIKTPSVTEIALPDTSSANDAAKISEPIGIKTLDSLRSAISDNNAEAFSSDFETITFSAEAANDKVAALTDTFSSLSGAIGSFSEAASKGNEKSFKSFQKLQVAMSTVAAVSAAIQAANDPKIQGFAKVAAYASVLGTLLSGVAQLKSISLGSSGSVSATGSTASTPSGPSGVTGFQQPQQQSGPRRIVNVTIQGNGTYTADQIEELIDAINDNDTGNLIRADRVA